MRTLKSCSRVRFHRPILSPRALANLYLGRNVVVVSLGYLKFCFNGTLAYLHRVCIASKYSPNQISPKIGAMVCSQVNRTKEAKSDTEIDRANSSVTKIGRAGQLFRSKILESMIMMNKKIN